jgi:beta-N-acetylhexosaminidase
MDLSTWSLEEKLGQLFLVYFEGPLLSPALEEMIREYHIGGLIFYSIAGNIQTLSQVAQLTTSAQAQSRIPLWMGIDQEGGPVVRLTEGVTVFPSAMAVAAAGSLEDAEAMAQVVGIELKNLGFNLNFAPVVDVNSNPHNPIIGIRAFGSDPKQVADYGLAMLRGYRQAGILCTPKHFPGHGDTHIDSHLGLPRVDRPLAELQATELPPLQCPECLAGSIGALGASGASDDLPVDGGGLAPAWRNQPDALAPLCALSMVPAARAGLGTGIYFSGGAVASSLFGLLFAQATFEPTVLALIGVVAFLGAGFCVMCSRPVN